MKLQDGVYEDEHGNSMLYEQGSPHNTMRRAIVASQAKTKEVSINRENRRQNVEESTAPQLELESPTGCTASELKLSLSMAEASGDDRDTGLIAADEDLLPEDNDTMVGVNVSCFHEFEGSPC